MSKRNGRALASLLDMNNGDRTMRYLQVSLQTLDTAGYSIPAQANTFFPAGDQTDHIHIGVPTAVRDGDRWRTAEPGNVFATFISFKRKNAFWFRLDHNEIDGYFSFPRGHDASELPKDWQQALRALRIVRGLGA